MRTIAISLSKRYLNSFAGLSTNCWSGILLSLAQSTLTGTIYFLSIYFVDNLHLTIKTASTIIAYYGLGAILGGILGGKLSDKTSPATISILSLLLQAVGFLALVKLTNVYLLMINLFIIGIATYGFITANYLWVLNRCGNHRAQKLKAINILSTASNLGLSLSAMMITLLIPFGFKFILLASGIITAGLAIFLVIGNKPEDITETVTDTTQIKPLTLPTNKSRVVIGTVLLSVVLIGSIVSQLSSTYAIYIKTSFPAYGITAVSILFTINSLMVVLFETPIGQLLGNTNKLLMVGVGGFLIGTGMLILSFSYIFFLAILACLVYTLGEIIFFCMSQLLCYEYGSKKSKGQSLGIYRMVYASSRVIGPAVGGYIYYNFSGEMVWYVSGVIGIVCLSACAYFRKYVNF
jgi:MFS family permease